MQGVLLEYLVWCLASNIGSVYVECCWSADCLGNGECIELVLSVSMGRGSALSTWEDFPRHATN